jgi:hypothetical protein
MKDPIMILFWLTGFALAVVFFTAACVAMLLVFECLLRVWRCVFPKPPSKLRNLKLL